MENERASTATEAMALTAAYLLSCTMCAGAQADGPRFPYLHVHGCPILGQLWSADWDNLRSFCAQSGMRVGRSESAI